MSPEFSARRVALAVVEQLERRRPEIAHDPGAVRAEVERALEPVRRAYVETELPPSYFAALEHELREVLPARWQALAGPFTALERRRFGLWRGGDFGARLTYVLAGLVIGGLCVWAPFIPIWEKWFPFALAGAAWWLPDAQVAWHRRRYGRELGAVVSALERTQGRLEATVSLAELMPAERRPK